MKKSFIITLFIFIAALMLAGLSACNIISSEKPPDEDNKTMLTADMIAVAGSYTYTGQPIEPPADAVTVRINKRLLDAKYYTISYRDNVNAGEGVVIVTITSDCETAYGSAERNFTISPATADTDSVSEAVTYLSDANYKTVRLTTDGAIDEDLTVPTGKLLVLSGNIRIEGKVECRGQLTLSPDGQFINVGEIVNEGSLSVSGTLYNSGSISGSGEFSNAGYVYLNQKPAEEWSQKFKVIVRQPLSGCDIALENTAIKFVKGVGEYFPGKITVTMESGYTASADRFSPEYADNDRIGTAIVTLTAALTDISVFGSATVNYEIVRGDAFVSDFTGLTAALADEDYANVYANSLIIADAPLVIPDGYTVSIKSLSAGQVTSDGTLEVTDGFTIAELDNRGDLTLSGGGSIESLINSGDILIGGGSAATVFKGDYENDGSIVNEGKVVFASPTPLSAGSFANADGKAYGYSQVSGISENFVVKRDVSDSQVFSLEFVSKAYNGGEIKPQNIFGAGGIAAADYTLSYLRDGSATTDFENIGTIEVKLEIAEYSANPYKGSVVLSYTIERGVCHANSQNNFIAALSNPNYAEVVAYCTVNTTSVEIPDYMTVYTKGQKLYFDEVTNYGVIVADDNTAAGGGQLFRTQKLVNYGEVTVYEAAGTAFSADKVENFGRIENYGALLIRANSASYFIAGDNSEFINHGTAYLNARDGVTPTGEGETVARRYVNDEYAYSLEYYSAYYCEEALFPELTIIFKESEQPVIPEGLSVIYSDNLNAGTASITIGEGEDEFAPYYGVNTLNFEIKRATCEVAGNTNRFLQVVADGNWERITLTSDVYIASSHFAVQENTVLDLGGYSLMLDENNIPDLPESSQILAEAGDKASFERNLGIATTIKLTADIGDGSDIYTFDSADRNFRLCLDLNRYEMKSAIVVQASANSTTLDIISSQGEGWLSGVNAQLEHYYALTVYSGNQNPVTVGLDGVKITGLSLAGGSSNTKICQVTATDCIFVDTEKAAALTHGGSQRLGVKAYFTGCEITGRNPVSLYGGEEEIIFTDCQITATGVYDAPYYPVGGKGYAVLVSFGRSTHTRFVGCTLTSQNGYALVQIQEKSGEYNSSTYSVTLSGCALSGAAGQVYAQSQSCILYA